MERVLAEVAKDYTEESELYKLADNLFNYTKADMVYALSTDENGDLYAQPLPDAFGTNGVTLTDDQAQRLVWHPEDVDEGSPFAVAPQTSLKGDDGWYYTTLYTDFPFRVLSPDVDVYAVSAVDAATGAATLEEIPDSKVPACTPVVVRSKSVDLSANQLLPLDEEVAAVEGNLLKGTFFPQKNDGTMKTLTLSGGHPAFLAVPETVAGNSAYFDGQVANGLRQLSAVSTSRTVYDLQGRRMNGTAPKGIYVINGRKVVVR